VYSALLAIINNIAPFVQDLQRATSSKLVDLFASMSSPMFLLEKEGNHVMLLSLLQTMNAILEHQYEGTRSLCSPSGLCASSSMLVLSPPVS